MTEQAGKYTVLGPGPRWPGGETLLASAPGGGTVVLREASRAEAGSAPFLSHPCLPACLGEAEVGNKKYLVYGHFAGASLEDALAAGGRFTEFESIRAAYEVAKALAYLHALSPRVVHGGVGAGAVFSAAGGRLLLCGRGEGTEPGDDLKALGSLMRQLAAAPKGEPFSREYFRAAEYLELPGADAGTALKRIETVGAGPVSAPQSRLQIFKRLRRGLPLFAWPLAAGVLLLAFYGAFYVRLELYPQFRARRLVAATSRLYREFNCSAQKAPGPLLGENLLVNPGLEGPCGWSMVPAFDGAVLKKGGAHSGEYSFASENDMPLIHQEADVTAFSERIAAGRCRVELSAWLRASGSGKDGDPYLYGYAMRSGDDYTYLSTCQPVRSENWTYSSCEFQLPAGTKKVRFIMESTVYAWSLFSRTAHYDDASLKVFCY